MSRRSYNKGVVNTTENFSTVVGLSPSIIIFPTFVGLSLRNDNSWYLLILCHKEKETGLEKSSPVFIYTSVSGAASSMGAAFSTVTASTTASAATSTVSKSSASTMNTSSSAAAFPLPFFSGAEKSFRMNIL